MLRRECFALKAWLRKSFAAWAIVELQGIWETSSLPLPTAVLWQNTRSAKIIQQRITEGASESITFTGHNSWWEVHAYICPVHGLSDMNANLFSLLWRLESQGVSCKVDRKLFSNVAKCSFSSDNHQLFVKPSGIHYGHCMALLGLYSFKVQMPATMLKLAASIGATHCGWGWAWDPRHRIVGHTWHYSGLSRNLSFAKLTFAQTDQLLCGLWTSLNCLRSHFLMSLTAAAVPPT